MESGQPQPSTGKEASPTAEMPRGAVVQPFYAWRDMKFYAVAEHELDSLSMMNTLNSILFGVGVSLISLAVGIIVNFAFTEKVTPEGNVLAKFGAPTLIVFGLVALAVCRGTRQRRQKIWDKILAESKSGPA